MRLILLGTGTGTPSGDRGSPCLLLIHQGDYHIFDLGPGAIRQLARAGVAHERISHIFITHFHPDHTADLIHFLFASRNPGVLGKRSPFLLVGPQGFREFLDKLQKPFGKWLKLPDHIMAVDELDTGRPDAREYGPWTLLSQPLRHTPQSLAYRVEAPSGASFVYSGDTGLCNEFIDFALGTDLLLLECSFPEGKGVEGHLSPSQAGWMAAQARVKKLVLLHFYPEVLGTDIALGCRKEYNGEIILGQDFLHLDV